MAQSTRMRSHRRSALQRLVQDYSWIHTGLGTFGNFSFFVGSILFLPEFEPWKVTGVWLFIVGAGFMLIGSLGNLLVEAYEDSRTPPHDGG